MVSQAQNPEFKNSPEKQSISEPEFYCSLV